VIKSASEPANSDVLDPVCGKPVDPLRARAVGIYAGITRYFCSQECKAKFSDPRMVSGNGPNGVERRWTGEQPAPMPSMPSSNSNEWFVKGEAESKVPQARAAERFTDLDNQPPIDKEMAPTPSIMIEVQASRRGAAPWLWLAVAIAGGVVLAFIGLR
jgi:YHS domain-containing protein